MYFTIYLPILRADMNGRNWGTSIPEFPGHEPICPLNFVPRISYFVLSPLGHIIFNLLFQQEDSGKGLKNTIYATKVAIDLMDVLYL